MMLVQNRASLLEAAMRSVLAQSDPDLELIVLDDGSTDASLAIAQLVAVEDPRVRVLANGTPIGIPASRNKVLAAARGRYVAVCDSDDVSHPDRFVRQRALLDAEPSLAAVGTRFVCVGDDISDPAGIEPGWHWGLRDGRLPFLFPTAMLRVDAVRAVGGFNERYPLAEDLELAYRIAADGGRFASVDEVLVEYRIHPGSITQRRALAREWHNLRAQLAGARRLRGRLSPRGWAVIVQSVLRTALVGVGLRR